MSDNGLDKEREFLIIGARTYLDVEDAMAEFRRRIQDQCATLVAKRLREIDRACEMDWTSNDVRDYQWGEPDCFHVGKKILVKDLGNQGGLYFCLELLRRGEMVVCDALVYLYRERGSVAVELWACLGGTTSDNAYSDGHNLIFKRQLSEEKIPEFQEHLNPTIDEFLAFIGGCGGLRKYLPQGQ